MASESPRRPSLLQRVTANMERIRNVQAASTPEVTTRVDEASTLQERVALKIARARSTGAGEPAAGKDCPLGDATPERREINRMYRFLQPKPDALKAEDSPAILSQQRWLADQESRTSLSVRRSSWAPSRRTSNGVRTPTLLLREDSGMAVDRDSRVSLQIFNEKLTDRISQFRDQMRWSSADSGLHVDARPSDSELGLASKRRSTLRTRTSLADNISNVPEEGQEEGLEQTIEELEAELAEVRRELAKREAAIFKWGDSSAASNQRIEALEAEIAAMQKKQKNPFAHINDHIGQIGQDLNDRIGQFGQNLGQQLVHSLTQLGLTVQCGSNLRGKPTLHAHDHHAALSI